MANEVSAQTDVTTDPVVATGETYTKTSTTVTGTITKGNINFTGGGLEILDNAGTVIKRKHTAISAGAPASANIVAQLTGLTAGTTYKCRMYRGDVILGDL
jgi:hypothetical protein